MSDGGSASAGTDNPYPGLLYFDHANSHLFFGREGQSDALLGRLSSSRFLAVVGTSGSGKSSLVHAGLLPCLWGGYLKSAGSDWLVADFRPGSDPIGRMAGELSRFPGFESQAALEAKLHESSLALAELVRGAALDGHSVLLLVDQFEELFRFETRRPGRCAKDEKAAFVKLLLEAARAPDLPLYVVISMRSDFLGDCAAFRDLPEAISNGQYLIPRLTREQQRSAIEGPARVSGATISNRLVQRLLNDTAEGQDQDQLPLLQHVLMRTWDEWAKAPSGPIDVAHYEAIGTLSGALSKHADETLAEVARDVRDGTRLTKTIFQRLAGRDTEGRETRRDCLVEELMAVSGRSFDDIKRTLDAFRKRERAFVMPLAQRELTLTDDIDITHECLLRKWEPLRSEWIPEEVESARIYAKLVDRVEDQTLMTGKALTTTVDWWNRSRPNAAWAARYRGDFAKAKDFKQRSQRWRWAKVGIGLVLGCAAGGYGALMTGKWVSAKRASYESELLRDAERQGKEAAITFLMARTAASLVSDPSLVEVGALLGATAYFERKHCGGTSEALDAMARALQALPASTRSLPVPGATKLSFAAQAGVLAVAAGDGLVTLWRTADLHQLGQVRASDQVRQMELSSDAKRLAFGMSERVEIFKLSGLDTDSVSAERELEFSCEDESWLTLARQGTDAVATCGTRARWYERTGAAWRERKLKDGNGEGWVAAPDGKRASKLSVRAGEPLYVIADETGTPIIKRSLQNFSGEWDVARADISQIVWSPAARTLDVASVLDQPGGQPLRVSQAPDGIDADLHLSAAGDIKNFLISDHATMVLAASSGGQLQLWTLPGGSERLHLRFDKEITELAVDDQHGEVAIAFADEVKLVRLTPSQRVAVYTPSVTSGGVVLRAGNPPRTMAVRVSDSGTAIQELGAGGCLRGQVGLSGDGSRTAVVSCDGKVRVAERANPNLELVAPVQGTPRRIVMSEDGLTLAVLASGALLPTNQTRSLPRNTAEALPEMLLFRVDTKSLAQTIVPLPEQVKFWEFARSGRSAWLAPASKSGKLQRYDVGAGTWTTLDISIPISATAFAVSPDDTRVAIASYEGDPAPGTAAPALTPLIQVWNVEQRKAIDLIAKTEGDTMGATVSIAFSGKGKELATADGSTVRVWDLAGRQLARFALSAPVSQVGFSLEGGQVLAIAGGRLSAIPWQDATLRKAVCRSVGRNLTLAEWKKYVPLEAPKKLCRDLP